MHLNKTRIILIVMIVSTIVLGAVAVFVGWRLQQNQISTDTRASSCSCPGGYQGPDQYQKCWSETESGKSIPASCTNDVPNPTPPPNSAGEKTGDPISCIDICCTPSGGQVGCVRAKYNLVGGGTGDFDVNGGAAFCNNGNHVDSGSCKATVTTPAKCGTSPACTSQQVCVSGACVDANSATACTNAGGCWNTGGIVADARGCTAAGSEWCGTGNCVAGRTDLCKYKCVGGVAVNQNTACVAGSCQSGYCLNVTPTSGSFGQCVSGSAPSQRLCIGSTLTNCQLCECGSQCDYNGGQECRKNCHAVACNTAVPDCAQLDFGCPGSSCGGTNLNNCANCTIKPTVPVTPPVTPPVVSSSISSSTSSAPIIPASLNADIGGRVYCQDTGGQPIPIPGTIVAITVGSTVINATTDADGYYSSPQFSFPTSGVDIAADVSALPTTFNNGLGTSQLIATNKAENCLNMSTISASCTGGVTPNFYCDSATLQSNYANCHIAKEGDLRGFRFKYTNCSATVSKCGDGVVDAGETCDPVGSVGQCANGGKCLTGCSCATCGSTCTTNDQCPNGYACSNGLCRNPACPSATECGCGTPSVPVTAISDNNGISFVLGFVLILLGAVLLRSRFVMGLVTPALVGVFGTSILKYVDPELAKKEYEKSVIDSEEEEE